MKRREFILLLGSAAVAWSYSAHAQERMRRIGVLTNGSEANADARRRLDLFRKALMLLGWSEGANLVFDIRWGENNPERDRRYATELIALSPDVILSVGTLATTALRDATSTLPVVFASVADPVGSDLVDSLARPGGNITGFMTTEFGSSGKWLELLKEMAPKVTRVAVLRIGDNPAAIAQFGALQAVAPSLSVELRPLDVRDAGQLERAVETFARAENGGLIVAPSATASARRDLIIGLAARYRLPAVYALRAAAAAGGMASYGSDERELYKGAAGYVDRILKGEKPGELPVQAPNKLELVINLRTAKALDLDVPASLLARADEVIE